MFGRNRENRKEQQREKGRRALFEELAKRPPNICPFLGLATSQTEYHDGITREHRCYASGEAAELSAEQQERVCLTRGYGNCPRYLRGVLVIPTDELEALRRPPVAARPPAPKAPPKPPPPPPARRVPAPASGGGRNRLPLVIGLVLLLAVAGAAGAFLFLRGPAAVEPTPSPSPSSQPSPTASASASTVASASALPASQTPFPQTPKPEATPLPGDVFVGYEVTVLEGQNTLFHVDDAGAVTGSVIAHYNRFSKAPVTRVQAPNGLLHWRTSEGFFAGLSYIHGDSGPFLIREVYQGADGTHRYLILPDNQT